MKEQWNNIWTHHFCSKESDKLENIGAWVLCVCVYGALQWEQERTIETVNDL